MNTFKKIAIGALLALSSLGAFAQTSLTQTTIASAVPCGPACAQSGAGSGVFQTFINLTSNTGVQLAALGAQPVTYVYVDQELFGILSLVPGQTNVYNVLRAQFGTKVSAHNSGAMALVEVVSPQFGGFSGSGGFQVVDPPFNGQCLSTATLVTPWVNVITADQWLCSSVTNTWVPGFNNRYGSAAKPTAAVASAAGLVTPSGPLFHITGALAITGFNIPTGFNGGQICVIPDGTFTTTNANNIALASTAVVSKQLCWNFDPVTAKFYPSY